MTRVGDWMYCGHDDCQNAIPIEMEPALCGFHSASRTVLIEAGARALYGPDETGDSLNARQMREGCQSIAEDVLEAVLPLVVENIAGRIETLRDGPYDLRSFGWPQGMTDAARIVREWEPS